MNVKTFVHVSSPCSSGSPLKRFGDGEPKDSDWEWYDLFPKVERYLKLGDANSFELPWNNDLEFRTLSKDFEECRTQLSH